MANASADSRKWTAPPHDFERLAKAFLGDWGFDASDIEIPVRLFYGGADRNVPLQMGKWYRDTIPDSELTVYKGEGHFIMYTRAEEILSTF